MVTHNDRDLKLTVIITFLGMTTLSRGSHHKLKLNSQQPHMSEADSALSHAVLLLPQWGIYRYRHPNIYCKEMVSSELGDKVKWHHLYTLYKNELLYTTKRTITKNTKSGYAFRNVASHATKTALILLRFKSPGHGSVGSETSTLILCK